MLSLADIWARLDERLNALRRLPADLDVTRRALGRLLATRSRALGPASPLQEAEFSIYSQWGDDGIIQFLLQHVDVPVSERTFVEFGVSDYSEANTRFLLVNDNWRGLVMDGSEANVARIKQDPISWRHDLTGVSAFIDTQNINALLREHGMTGQIGLLHIDIDGNDYWVWEAIDVVDPTIVIVEYNAVFGRDHAITIPQDAKFQRTRAHHSNLYWGASLKALVKLATSKGYVFVGCNSAGNNAYFIRRDRLGSIPPALPGDGFVDSRFRESRNSAGALTFVSGDERLALIADMPVVDLESGRTVPIRSLQKPSV